MKEIVITKNNVRDLWEAYDEIYCLSANPNITFEEFVSKLTICENCGEYVLKDDIGTSSLAETDNVCKWCIEDGYGE